MNTQTFDIKKGRFIYNINYDNCRWNMASVQITRNYQITLSRDIRRKIPMKHRITKQEAMEFMKKNFNVKVGEE